MKEKFEEPSVEVIRFNQDDVIADTSGSGLYSWRDNNTVSDK